MARSSLEQIVAALQQGSRFPHPVERFELIETHISYVLLTGRYVYKFKKPLRLEFLDFSSLDRRRFYCEEELRLNRRLAPEIYLDVVAVTGSPQQPEIGGHGEAIEYAVRMRQFSQSERLDRVLASGALETAQLEDLALQLASFHRDAAVARPGDRYACVAEVAAAMGHNYDAVAGCAPPVPMQELTRLHRDNDARLERLGTRLQQRLQDGCVRECHGDLHLANIALHEGRPLVFDCIEFNPALRWIDVISEVAFLVMDLEHRRRPDLGWAFLNAYLSASGDYAGLALLPLYLGYRAMVRAKVACIRLQQPDCTATEQDNLKTELVSYLELARACTRNRRGCLLITCGLSGSGKTTLARELASALGAVHIRSDVERKRLAGLAPQARSNSGIDDGLYSAAMHERTYQRLQELALAVLDAGYPVIVDAAFLRRGQRERFRHLAQDCAVPFRTVYCHAPPRVLEQRVEARRAGARDASEADAAVLKRQLATAQLPAADEGDWTLEYEGAAKSDCRQLLAQLQRVCAG